MFEDRLSSSTKGNNVTLHKNLPLNRLSEIVKEFGLSLIIIWNYLKIPVQLALNPGFWALPILAQKYDHFSMISEVYASKFGVSMGAGSQQSIVAYHTSCCCLLAFSKLVFTGQLKTIINNNLFYAQNAGNCTSELLKFKSF